MARAHESRTRNHRWWSKHRSVQANNTRVRPETTRRHPTSRHGMLYAPGTEILFAPPGRATQWCTKAVLIRPASSRGGGACRSRSGRARRLPASGHPAPGPGSCPPHAVRTRTTPADDLSGSAPYALARTRRPFSGCASAAKLRGGHRLCHPHSGLPRSTTKRGRTSGRQHGAAFQGVHQLAGRHLRADRSFIIVSEPTVKITTSRDAFL